MGEFSHSLSLYQIDLYSSIKILFRIIYSFDSIINDKVIFMSFNSEPSCKKSYHYDPRRAIGPEYSQEQS